MRSSRPTMSDLPRRLLRRLRKMGRVRVEGKNRAYDRLTRAVMRRVLRSDSCGVDIGCHRGAFLREMALLAPQGEHYTFEPLSGLFANLREEFGHLGNVPFFHVSSTPALSGLEPDRSLRLTERVVEVKVPVRRLDDVLPPSLCPAFVKIDVEGSEHAVLRGAAATIRRSGPTVVFEYDRRAARLSLVRPDDTHRLLDELGLRVFRLTDWLDRRESLSARDFADDVRRGREFYFLASP